MNGFHGYYVKCQGEQDTVAVIFGWAQEGRFVQIITEEHSFYFDYNDNCSLDEDGLVLDLEGVTGDVRFGPFTKIKGDIMGPFRWLPFMECRHMIISMAHKISGHIKIGDKTYNFDNGVGYIEGDRGKGFPRKYFWTQAHFGDTSIFAATAIIPYLGIRFLGTICVVMLNGREYRLATYRGARVKKFDSDGLVIKQGRLKLVIDVLDQENSRPLLAPARGKMTRTIHESIKRKIRYQFTRGDETLLDEISERAAYEFSDLSGR